MPVIDTTLIPAVEVQVLCATVLDAVNRFYEDPENQKRFQEWQQRRNADKVKEAKQYV